jgi:hypothetical protein
VSNQVYLQANRNAASQNLTSWQSLRRGAPRMIIGQIKCFGKLSQLNTAVGCGQIRQDAGENILQNSDLRASL